MTAPTILSPDNPNQIIIHEDYIEVVYSDKQTLEQMHEINLAEKEAVERFRDEAMPVLVLADITNNARPKSDVFKEGVTFLDSVMLDRLALYGRTSLITRSLINIVMTTFKRDYRVKYFKSRELALAWLRESSD